MSNMGRTMPPGGMPTVEGHAISDAGHLGNCRVLPPKLVISTRADVRIAKLCSSCSKKFLFVEQKVDGCIA